LLQVLLSGTPGAFEKVVVDLLVAVGYGGSLEDAGSVVGKSGDGGIDGVIKQDKLGLDVVYVQAKRRQNVVGSPEIMRFSGSLTKQHASKGVFITTSYFSKDALEYVEAIPQKIVLIDGVKLASFMIDHNVGVAPAKSYIRNVSIRIISNPCKPQTTMPANTTELEKRLWGAADELRANSKLKSSEYSVPVLGLIFLRYADHKFAKAEAVLKSQGTGRRTIGKADYSIR
jgi:Restriction endonuclease/HsdM N-terminal domain